MKRPEKPFSAGRGTRLDKSILSVTTPENVELRFETVGLGSRSIAFLIDFIIQAVFIGILAAALYNAASNGFISYSAAESALIISLFAIIFGYALVFETIMRGKTPGKAAMGIRVIKKNGRPADFLSLLVRNLLRIVDFLPAFYGVGIVMLFLSAPPRRLGDIAAGTVVVREYGRLKARSYISSIPAPAPAYTEQKNCSYPLTAEEFGVVKGYVQRAAALKPKVRYELSARLAHPLYEKFLIPVYQRNDPEGFLFWLYNMNRG